MGFVYSSSAFVVLRLIFAAGVACTGSAAQSAHVRGIVLDPRNTPVQGALVLLYQAGGSSSIGRTITDPGGRFQFAVPDSTSIRLLEVSAPGFGVTSLRVEPGVEATVHLSVEGLDQRILVTAESAAQTVDQISKAASVVSAAEIEQRNEYSLAEALRDTPGMLVRNLGGPGQSTSLRIRGLRADATAILVDGMRFRDAATTQGDASSFLSTLNVIDLDRIEVLRGSGSSLYGTNAVGGTVNIVSNQGGGPRRIGMQLEGGSLGLLRSRANVSGGGWKDRLGYSAGLLHLNVLRGVDGDDRARSNGSQAFLRYAASERTSLSVRVLFSDDFVQPNLSPTASGVPGANIPGATIVPAIPLGEEQVRRSALGQPIAFGNATFIPNRNDPDNRRASRMWSAAAILRQRLSADVDVQVSYNRGSTNRVFQNGPAGASSQPPVSNFSRFRGLIDTVDLRANWLSTPWGSLAGGYEFENEDYLNADDNRLPAPAAVSTRTEAGQRAQAVYFASQNALLKQRLQLSLSGRMQHFSTRQPVFRYAGAANNYASAGFHSPPAAVTADGAVSYFLPRTATKIRAHMGNSYRAPGLYERFGSGFSYNATLNAVVFSPYGDPRLAPDRYNSADAGIDQYFFLDRVRVSATWFYTRIVQITQFDSSGGAVVPGRDVFGRTSGYFNGSGGTSRGVEVSLEARLSRSSLVRTSYSYTNADTNQDTPVRGFFRAFGVPAHTWAMFWNQRIGRGTELSLDGYHSGSYYNPLSAAGRSRAYLYPGFTKLDAVVSRKLRDTDRFSTRLYGKVENFLNQRYFENGFQAPRVTALLGIGIQFK